jgi:hypothetical protein
VLLVLNICIDIYIHILMSGISTFLLSHACWSQRLPSFLVHVR